MKTNQPVRYQWVVLFAFALWLVMVLGIVSGKASKDVKLVHASIPAAMALIGLIPISVRRFTASKWFSQIASTWVMVSSLGIHRAGTELLGLSHRCDRVVLVSFSAFFIGMNVVSIGKKLWKRRKRVGQDSNDRLAEVTSAMA